MVLKEEIELQGKGSTTQKGIVETAPSLLLNLLLLRADLRVFRNRIKSRDCANRKGVLKTRDIPTLNYRSTTAHLPLTNWDYNPPFVSYIGIIDREESWPAAPSIARHSPTIAENYAL